MLETVSFPIVVKTTIQISDLSQVYLRPFRVTARGSQRAVRRGSAADDRLELTHVGRLAQVEREDPERGDALVVRELPLEVVDVQVDLFVDLREQLPGVLSGRQVLAAAVLLGSGPFYEAAVLEPLRETRCEGGSDVQPVGQIDDAERLGRAENLDERLMLERLEVCRLRLLVDDPEDLPDHVARFGYAVEVPLQAVAVQLAGLVPAALDPVAHGVDDCGRATSTFGVRHLDSSRL